DEVDCIQWIKRCLNIFDVNTWTPPYHLAIPENWTVERFPLPPDFAQQITYKGIEDLRFAPGWADFKSDEYWSYAYLWLLDGSVKIDILSLKENLKAYYDGLIAQNITVRNIPANKIFRTTAIVNKTKTYAGDFETYTGEIHMLDYMNQQPVILNTIIHVKNCSIERHTVVFVEISPKPYGHSIWVKLNKLAADIQCNK
ncbi:MAG TPA: hypothetical protein VGO09_07260, partial [Flavisolibacter sp.]|nr:hypothetical protein [Flavisolibacter sp.]